VDLLPPDSPERACLSPLGEVQLKGRQEPVSIWGIPRARRTPEG
jgi:class 3 adenylate cyclase